MLLKEKKKKKGTNRITYENTTNQRTRTFRHSKGCIGERYDGRIATAPNHEVRTALDTWLHPSADVPRHRCRHRRQMDWCRSIGSRGRIHLHHLPRYGLLQRSLRRLRHTRSASVRGEGLPQDAHLRSQRC